MSESEVPTLGATMFVSGMGKLSGGGKICNRLIYIWYFMSFKSPKRRNIFSDDFTSIHLSSVFFISLFTTQLWLIFYLE